MKISELGKEEVKEVEIGDLNYEKLVEMITLQFDIAGEEIDLILKNNDTIISQNNISRLSSSDLIQFLKISS